MPLVEKALATLSQYPFCVVNVAPPPLVAAVSVAAVLPISTVHTGTFDVTQIAELGVMVMVSDTPPAPAAPVLRAPLAEGVKTNRCLIGAMPSVSWLNDVAEPQAAEAPANDANPERNARVDMESAAIGECCMVRSSRCVAPRGFTYALERMTFTLPARDGTDV